MTHCFATFPAGCYDIIARQLKSRPLEALRIVDHDDSSVIFQTTLRKEQLIELRFFTNVFVVADAATALPRTWLRGEHFRLMGLRAGQPVAIEPKQRETMAVQISQWWHLSPRSREGNEFYLVERTAGQRFLALRLPRAKFKRDEHLPGELRPELAHILCLVAGLAAKHHLLELCAGTGAIALEAERGFGCRHIIAVDHELRDDRHQSARISWLRADVRQLADITTGTIDRVIADPPWGSYQAETNVAELYTAMMNEVRRVLKPGGVAVMLVPAELVTSLADSQLVQVAVWPILVSGKKATIVKLRKI